MKRSSLWIGVAFVLVVVVLLVFVFWNSKNSGPAGPGIHEPGFDTYTSTSLGFSILYPTAYDIDESHTYQGLGPGKEIHGVAFSTPETLTHGTNLSRDTYVAVESLDAGNSNCSALLFLGDTQKESFVTENNIRYSVAHSGEGAAGSLYQEDVYALVGSVPCVAMRYFVHSTNIGNYDPGTIIPFDKNSLLSVFDAMRLSLRLHAPEAPAP